MNGKEHLKTASWFETPLRLILRSLAKQGVSKGEAQRLLTMRQGCQAFFSSGTFGASFERPSVSEVFTLRTFGAAVSSETKA